MVTAEQDIEQSLCIILSTSPGERVMDPSFGCGLKSFIFQTLDATLEAQLIDEVSSAILFFEPRVELHQVGIEDEEPLHGKLQLRLDYSIIGTNTRTNLVFPFYLLEATDAQV